MNGFLNSPMNDYYKGWEFDFQSGQKISERFRNDFTNYKNRP
jgi:hypothetical protein